MSTTIEQWLKHWHSNGTHVELAELMYYRSKVGAFIKQQRQQRQTPTGVLLSKHKGRGMEFDEVRHYQPGDDIRAIDWRVTARTGSPHTKLYREERERPVMVVVDLGQSMQFGSTLLLKSVQACHLASAIAWVASHQGDRIGGLLGAIEDHAELKPMARQHGVLKLLQQLVRVQHEGINHSVANWQNQHASAHPVLAALLQRTLHVAKPGTIVYLVSDWLHFDDEAKRALQLLQRHCQVRPIQVFDPFEQQLPFSQPRPELAVYDQQHDLALSSRAALKAYQTAANTRQQQLHEQFRELGLQLRQVDASRPLEQQWAEVMQ
ncbi:DUF58 domain-containing protein [Pseudidiomarina taiwanensis]|uniref:DUF58 domain-containing protein n=1 Tax=Pseudidiomarina taiwanensis TaxID=337250 RepID=A0A432ZLU8_9GAMM|nr:DUF58 domain-containing protein [Pseudidiomarina taiwanensis]RUO78242.1 DUF58 domain-containing protein [Pseudidiomarina taiwanensis]